MRTFWIVFAALVFVANAVIHLSTFFGIDPGDYVLDFALLYPLAIPPFIAAIVYQSRLLPKTRDFNERLALHAPRSNRMIRILFVYAFAGLAVYYVVGKGSRPAIRGDKFVAESRGRVMRELSETEYHRLVGLQIRCISGFCLAGSGFAALFLAVTRSLPRIDPTSSSSSTELDEFCESVLSGARQKNPPVASEGPDEPTTVVIAEDPQEVVRNFLASVDLPAAARGDSSGAHKIEISHTRSELYSDPLLIFTPDELPKEAPSEAQTSPGSATDIVLFTFEGPDGREFQFRSLAEMPPDIRAQFERMMESTEDDPQVG